MYVGALNFGKVRELHYYCKDLHTQLTHRHIQHATDLLGCI